MKKRQFNKKVNEMIKDISKYLKSECKRLFECGGINPLDHKDNYALPKVCLYVALRNLAWQHKPFDKKYLDEAKNLEKF